MDAKQLNATTFLAHVGIHQEFPSKVFVVFKAYRILGPVEVVGEARRLAVVDFCDSYLDPSFVPTRLIISEKLVRLNAELLEQIGDCHIFLVDGTHTDPNKELSGYSLRLGKFGQYLTLQ